MKLHHIVLGPVDRQASWLEKVNLILRNAISVQMYTAPCSNCGEDERNLHIFAITTSNLDDNLDWRNIWLEP